MNTSTPQKRFAAGPEQSYLRDWVYGGIDGTATTFAIVAGVVGAHLSPRVPDPWRRQFDCGWLRDGSRQLSGYWSECEEFDHAEAVERRHIKTFPAGEREEVSELLLGLGIAGDLLKRVVAVTADRDRWVRMMLRYEYGLPAAVRSPWPGVWIDIRCLCCLRSSPPA
jgi:hypothetical protein